MYKGIAGTVAIMAVVIISGCAATKTDAVHLEAQELEEVVSHTDSGEGSVEKKESAEKEADNIFTEMPEHFTFSSGAGAWSTEITLSEEGSFEGFYHDSDMGDSGEEYPNGTVYICEFNGKFSSPVKVSEFIYECSIERLEWDKSKTEEFLDGVRYIYSDPYGLSASAKIRIYLPETPIAEVAEGFMGWSSIHSEQREYLPEGYYGIYNVDEEYGFVGIDDDCLWTNQYKGAIGDVEVELYPGYYESSLHLKRGDNYYSLYFDWYDDKGTDFVAADWEGKDEYDIHLERSEDRAELKVTLRNKSGGSMEQWGGNAEGELTVELERMVRE